MQIGNSALTGLIFTTGFFSKDVILEISVLGHSFFIESISQQIALITAVLTFLYSSRVVYYLFLNEVNTPNPLFFHFKNDLAYLFMILPLLPLMIFSMFFGYFAKTYFLGPSNVFDEHVMAQSLETNLAFFACELLPPYIKLLPALLTLAFSMMSLIHIDSIYKLLTSQALATSKITVTTIIQALMHFLYWRWYSDKFFDFLFQKILHTAQTGIIEVLERGIFDKVQSGSKYSLQNLSLKLGLFTRSFTQGNMHIYIAFILLTIMTIFILTIL
jgi:NADH:ubiquinone oxidoreductase subunit 5 (subunit L)/multisubunit Na+/H+ antiporter MnhA subunit